MDFVDVLVGIDCVEGVFYVVLMLNMWGFEGVVVVKVDEIVIFGLVFEGFFKVNINVIIVESFEWFELVVNVVKF